MRPLGAVAAVAIVIASGCAGVNAAPRDQGASEPIAIERSAERADANAQSGQALPSNPSEDSFGSLQEDGTYCGVTCWESH